MGWHPSDLPDLPDWKRYEHQVLEQLQEKYPDVKLDPNVKLEGRLSHRKRQIDIKVTVNAVGHPLLGIIDCKRYSRKVNVKTIESFIGLMADVNADFGVIFTESGFSKAAEERAESGRVRLKILKLDEIKDYDFPIDLCEWCDPQRDNPFANAIDWCMGGGVGGDTDQVADIGFCMWCNQIYVRCKTCNIPVALTEYSPTVECEGGCGTVFTLDRTYDHDGIEEFILHVEHKPEF